MQKRQLVSRPLQLAIASVWWLCPDSSHAQFATSLCEVNASGQTVRVNVDGSFQISNIPANNQLLRIDVLCLPDGISLFGASEYFTLAVGQTYQVAMLPLSPLPLPSIVSLAAESDTAVLTTSGQTAQVSITALLSNGFTDDVTPLSKGTTYATSNPAIATVDSDGLVTAAGNGRALITCVNQGVTAVARVAVSFGDPLTNVEGFVQFDDLAPASGVSVEIPKLGVSTISGADGSFSLPGLPTELGSFALTAQTVIGNFTYVGSTVINPFAGGLTDAGIIVIAAVGMDTDGDCIPDTIEAAIGLNSRSPDTDSDGIPDGDEDTDGDGLINCAEVGAGTALDDDDSDNDGFFDGEELTFLSDPLDPKSNPFNSGGLGEAIFGHITVLNTVSPELVKGEAFARNLTVQNAAHPGLLSGEMLGRGITVENAVHPGLLSGEMFGRFFTALNEVFPELLVGESFAAPMTVENQSLPDPNLPFEEAYGRPVSVENQAP